MKTAKTLCDIKIQVQVFDENKNLITKEKTIKFGVDGFEELNFENLAEYIIRLPEEDRKTLAAQLRAAKVQTLTESDLESHRFISNTSIEEIFTKYPYLKDAYPNLQINPEDNYTIIACKNLRINGHTYYGRVIDSSGNEIFILNGQFGAQRLIKFLDTKSKIRNSFEEGKLKESFAKYQEDLDSLSKQFKLSGEQLLIDFLGNKSKYKTYKDDGKIIIPREILSELLYKISGDYDPNLNKSSLQISLEEIKQKNNNNFVWKFQTAKLYDVLAFYYDDLPTKDEFLKMGEDDLSTLFSNIFKNDPMMYKSRIKKVNSGEEKEVTVEKKQKSISQKIINEVYSNVKKALKDQGITLPSLATLIKNSPEQALGLIKDSFISYKDDDGNSFEDLKVDIKDGKIYATYIKPSEIKTKTSSGNITLEFPWSTLGEIYDFSYSSSYIFSPVKKEGDLKDVLDEDGMYKGVYIYKYFEPTTKTTHYAVSRHIISPNTNMYTTANLNSALTYIENLNKTQKINTNGLWSIKQSKTRLRTAKIEDTKLSVGQLLTVIDIELPKVTIKNMPEVFRNVFNNTLPYFYKTFQGVENITELNTPEKAAAFILKFYNSLKLADKQLAKSKKIEDFSTLLRDNNDLIQKIISEINNAPKISYLIENIMGNYATLRYASNNGTDIKIHGKFDDGVQANTPTIESMNNAVDYFNKTFGLSIKVLSREELLELSKDNNLKLENKLDSVKAFVLNGEIYINGTTADISDLFHEMSHIFLGVLKVKYPNTYKNVINSYIKSKKFSQNFNYINRTYRNLSHQDKLEETVAEIIANQMFNKNSLVSQFKGEEFVDDFKVILTKFPELVQDIQTSGLEFSGFMKNILTTDTKKKIIRNMKITNLVESFIRDGKIIETNC